MPIPSTPTSIDMRFLITVAVTKQANTLYYVHLLKLGFSFNEVSTSTSNRLDLGCKPQWATPEAAQVVDGIGGFLP
jgi:hypothetical protein